MSDDARFEDGEEKALNMGAFDNRDIQVVSSFFAYLCDGTHPCVW